MSASTLRAASLVITLGGAALCVYNILQKQSKKMQAVEAQEEEVIPQRKFVRRNSVSAECGLNPDTILATAKVVYGKSDSERAAIGKAIKSNLLFQGLSEEHLAEVVDSMYPLKFKTGDIVIKQGDSGNEFFVATSGDYEVEKDEGSGPVRKGVIKAGGTFGELALMYNTPRAATIRAVGAGPHEAWATDRTTFTRVLMRCFTDQRGRHEGFLEQVPLFQEHMDRFDRLRLADAFEAREYAQGDEIVREGEKGDTFFVIEEGEARVVRGGKVVNHLKPGSYFGEVAVLTQQPRLATVIAASSRLRVAVLDSDAFNRLMPDRVRSVLQAAVGHYSPAPL
jgi:cAMP-dependent protein kinase regulator